MIEILFPRMVPSPLGRAVRFDTPIPKQNAAYRGLTDRLRVLLHADTLTLPNGSFRCSLHGIAKHLGIKISYRKLPTGEILVRRVYD